MSLAPDRCPLSLEPHAVRKFVPVARYLQAVRPGAEERAIRNRHQRKSLWSPLRRLRDIRGGAGVENHLLAQWSSYSLSAAFTIQLQAKTLRAAIRQRLGQARSLKYSGPSLPGSRQASRILTRKFDVAGRGQVECGARQAHQK